MQSVATLRGKKRRNVVEIIHEGSKTALATCLTKPKRSATVFIAFEDS